LQPEFLSAERRQNNQQLGRRWRVVSPWKPSADQVAFAFDRFDVPVIDAAVDREQVSAGDTTNVVTVTATDMTTRQFEAWPMEFDC